MGNFFMMKAFPWYWRRSFARGPYHVDFYIDVTCLMVGVNYTLGPSRGDWSVYVHVGPIIIGVWRWVCLYEHST
jgi:hypothetical protein